MSKLSKKAILSVLSLVLTFVALGATTFAWFTLGNTASVGQFEAEIRGSEGLEIRFGENGEWLTNISESVMQSYIDDLVDLKLKLEAVSTTTDDLTKFSKSNNDNSNIMFDELATMNEDYLKFDLYFRTAQTGNVELNLENLTLSSTMKTWETDMKFNYLNDTEANKGENINVYAHEAARIMFNGKNNTIYEAPSSVTNIDIVEDFGANAYLAKKLGMTNQELFNLKSNQANYTTVEINDEFDVLNDIVQFETKEYNGVNYLEGKLTVTIWIEGWDGNAFDAILGETIQVSMNFRLNDQD